MPSSGRQPANDDERQAVQMRNIMLVRFISWYDIPELLTTSKQSFEIKFQIVSVFNSPIYITKRTMNVEIQSMRKALCL